MGLPSLLPDDYFGSFKDDWLGGFVPEEQTAC